MFRFLYTVFDLLATFFALASPVAILHWLLLGVGVDESMSAMAFLSGLFKPFNATLEMIYTPPAVDFSGEAVSTTQGAIGVLFTLFFFAFNASSHALKATEQKLQVAKDTLIHRHRMEKLKAEQKRKERAVSTNKKILVYLQCDFEADPNVPTRFETSLQKMGGETLEVNTGDWMLEFQSLERALNYCWEVGQGVLNYYQGLRPMDPQPPFKIALHAIEASQSSKDGYPKLEQLIKYAGNNYILFSTETHDLLQATQLDGAFKFQSMGMYQLELEKPQEVFRLLGQK